MSENEPDVETPEQVQPVEPAEQIQSVEPLEPPAKVEYELRRAPKYLPFGATGAVLGVVVGFVLALANPIAGDYSERAIIGYFAVILGLVGALVGLGIAVLIERRR